jgi:CheY-like chemotaxis protein
MAQKINILVVDDDSDDHEFFKQAVQLSYGPLCSVTSIYNGADALQFLFKEGVYADRRELNPDLLVLDLNMPLLDGMKVLEIVRSNAVFSQIPIFILTTSHTKEDKDKCEILGCSGFYTKPILLSQLRSVLEEMMSACVRNLEKGGF